MKLIYSVIFLIFTLVPNTVNAGDVTLTWTAPTQNTDGTPLTDLAGYKIYYGVTPSGPYPTAIDITDETLTSWDVVGLAPNTYYFVSTAYNVALIESDFSNEATKLVLAPAPNPPGNLTVQDLVVYTLVKQLDKFVLLPVGTVPGGTICSSTQSVNGHNVVPRAAVTWSGNIRPFVVVAKCS